jgi:hypothetical protein
MARSVSRAGNGLARAVLAGAVLLAMATRTAAAEPVVPAPARSPRSTSTIVDLQPFRSEMRVAVQSADGVAGSATLTNLNPQVNAWFLLTLDWGAVRPKEVYHLENARPARALTLQTASPGTVQIDFGDRSPTCTLLLAGARGRPGALDLARTSGLPYAPICDGRLSVRNRTVGRASSLEKVTDYLRDHVWKGEEIVTLVKKELYRDAFLEQGEPRVMTRTGAAPPSAPAAAIVDPARADLAVTPSGLGLDIDSADRALMLGQWYGVRGLPDVYLSVVIPEVIARDLPDGRERSVNRLDSIESTALVYLVAFDLGKFDLSFALGTEHPRLGWSPRPPPASIDRALPGPDGIDRAAPLAITGMVSPEVATRTVAAFTGGFKRDHGAFRYGALSLQNHGSHYGFVEQGVVFSRLQPGLATLFTTVSGDVQMGTWTQADNGRMANIRDARQNGVPLVEYDARTGASVPGPLVNRWGEGNWSGSATEDLRTLRAGACLQETDTRRFLIYGYFSAATPSAMARVFQAYRCRYAMHLDMNALEHTYLAVYVSQAGRLTVEHLISGMSVLDRYAGKQFAPRFLGFPDDRDFFILTRKESAP